MARERNHCAAAGAGPANCQVLIWQVLERSLLCEVINDNRALQPPRSLSSLL